ncbi:ABC transporter ATP-binding protein [Stygiolobus azoricus]|uniref:ATP-binding cassette domain-containing protein n=1 Tax=Stygiolobus azoricus TaxID=41675 RepID=A0A650CMQ2_9CREN|nr:ABC transporter ATP-binding protein [Stygiolobus azoricus]QGR19126.1 ATP-binding cassette domain-containing protein [Stygiolobus azoricus]
MIEIEHISKTFKVKSKEIRALDDVSFTIPKSSVGALVGHNGAGKTTLIKILSTLIIPDQGDARINGISIREEKKVRKNIGVMMVSERAFYFRLSGFDNLVFFGIVQGLSISEAKKRAKELLDLVGLSEFSNIQYMKYSTGMQRKLALARALLLDPPVILLDEPTLGMDPVSSRDFRSLVKELSKEGKTILMTSHNMKEVEDLADKIVLLKRGKVVAQGTREEITSSIGKIKVVMTDSIPKGYEKYVSGFVQGKVILRVPEKGIEVEGEVLGEEEPTLEDAFVYFTDEEIDNPKNRRRGGGFRRWE